MKFLPDLATILAIIPLTLIGLWRWTYWVIRIIIGRFYHPQFTAWPRGRKKPMVSLVTPVYNEDPIVFEQAMRSWIQNGVQEIIAVIDKTNVSHIVSYHKNYVTRRGRTKCRMIVTPKPGKRAALCDGIAEAKGDIIALVDSDTIWDKNVLKNTLPYFLDPEVGGTTVAQRISNPDGISNVMFDILLWTRYREEVPFLLGAGRVFNTLSGRTAFYRREALLNKDYDNLHSLRHEKFFRTRGVSGDDKRLTHLIVEQGWRLALVKGATVYTPGLRSMRKFLKQRLRWTRNSWRADLRAVKRGWVMQHPALAYFMIDRFFQPLFMLLGPIAFVTLLLNQNWMPAAILAAWWLVSRFIRLFPYFRAAPKRIVYLPAYIVYGYVNAIIKIYALATLLEHNWATRWHSYRLKTKRLFRRAVPVITGSAAVAVFLSGLYVMGQAIYQDFGGSVQAISEVNVGQFNQSLAANTAAKAEPQPPAQAVVPDKVVSYTVPPGETLDSLALRFNTTVDELKHINNIVHNTDFYPGRVIYYFDRSDSGGQSHG